MKELSHCRLIKKCDKWDTVVRLGWRSKGRDKREKDGGGLK